MFRVKITAMLTLVVLMVMAVVYFLLPPVLEDEFSARSRQALDVAATSMERDERLNDFSLMARAEEIAAFVGMRDAFTSEYEEPYEYNRHLGVYNKGLLRWQFIFSDAKKNREGQRQVTGDLLERAPHVPDLLFAVDEKGVGVAACCETSRYEWYKDDLSRNYPSLLSVADGRSRKDIWTWSWDKGGAGSFYQVGIAPIMQGPEKMLGAVIVGRQLSGDQARASSTALGGHQIAYFHKGQIFASTFNQGVDATLSKDIFGGALRPGDAPPPLRVTVNDEEHLAQVRYFQRNATGQPGDSGFIVLSSLASGHKLIQNIKSGILIIGLLILVMLLASVLIVIRSFVKPFEEIDQGIQEVLAGKRDYVFNITGNFPFQSEMAQSLNLMSAFLQNKRMPDEDDEPTEGWGELLIGEVSSTAMMRAIKGDEKPAVVGVPVGAAAAPPDLEPLDAYKRRIFNEYAKARQALGHDIEDLTFESFCDKLERHGEAIKSRHDARDVRFSVVEREGKVVLKPQPIF